MVMQTNSSLIKKDKKMKSIKNILGTASMMALTLSATSCTDGNDWDVDGSLSRLFGLNGDKITVETAETSATVTFSAFTSKAVPSPEYYVFEVSKDSLYEGVENANIIKFGEDKSLTSSPVVLSGLDGDSKYYMRVKAMSSTSNESKWVYYKDGSSYKTKAEQLFNELTTADLLKTTLISLGLQVRQLPISQLSTQQIQRIRASMNLPQTKLLLVKLLTLT